VMSVSDVVILSCPDSVITIPNFSPSNPSMPSFSFRLF
jgi:hypothetical protein